MPSILQEWVMELGRRHQGVLVSAMRGCDLAPRHDPSKFSQRLLRASVLIPHAGRLVSPKSYITIENDSIKWWHTMNAFINSWDHYPNHYVVHFIHAAEIIGYYGPVEIPVFSERWISLYERAVHILHMNPETKEQLSARLDADEEAFDKMQTEVYGRT